jgi:hypothetical protein
MKLRLPYPGMSSDDETEGAGWTAAGGRVVPGGQTALRPPAPVTPSHPAGPGVGLAGGPAHAPAPSSSATSSSRSGGSTLRGSVSRTLCWSEEELDSAAGRSRPGQPAAAQHPRHAGPCMGAPLLTSLSQRPRPRAGGGSDGSVLQRAVQHPSVSGLASVSAAATVGRQAGVVQPQPVSGSRWGLLRRRPSAGSLEVGSSSLAACTPRWVGAGAHGLTAAACHVHCTKKSRVP